MLTLRYLNVNIHQEKIKLLVINAQKQIYFMYKVQ